MAVAVVVTCPECEKKFKPKGEVQGKRIKCPFCKEAFVVPGAKSGKDSREAKAVKSKSADAKAKPEAAPAVQTAAAEPAKPAQNLEMDFNPYTVTNQDLAHRCPNCAQEMESAHAIVCKFCGYNTLLRTQGKTKKIVGLTFKRHIIYLLPPIGSAVFAVFIIGFMIYFAVVLPYVVAGGGFLEMFDHESMRMWGTAWWLFTVWMAGVFCYKKFIEQPKPDDITLD